MFLALTRVISSHQQWFPVNHTAAELFLTKNSKPGIPSEMNAEITRNPYQGNRYDEIQDMKP
jgi:hypothetical protein